MFCGKCGKELNQEDSFCPACGTALAEKGKGGPPPLREVSPVPPPPAPLIPPTLPKTPPQTQYQYQGAGEMSPPPKAAKGKNGCLWAVVIFIVLTVLCLIFIKSIIKITIFLIVIGIVLSWLFFSGGGLFGGGNDSGYADASSSDDGGGWDSGDDS
ncbi:zinc ribbon domain-containing protein [Azotosporobacter soli]|uniref:zinc ribbon domain-containing protein n=1 Tax=Azotosporobacter soli TaxID=3055040 RepID=UPI0031FECF5C